MALTDYEKYIRTEELLGLQKAREALTCHDEMQFQVVHQAHELYMKLIAHELEFVCTSLEASDPARAVTTLRRISTVQRVLLHSVDLLDTMAPTDYMTIRTGLGRGSGQESPGFRTMLKLPQERVWPAFTAFLERAGVTLRQIYDQPHDHHPLFQLCEGLVDYDQLLQTWRQRHLTPPVSTVRARDPSGSWARMKSGSSIMHSRGTYGHGASTTSHRHRCCACGPSCRDPHRPYPARAPSRAACDPRWQARRAGRSCGMGRSAVVHRSGDRCESHPVHQPDREVDSHPDLPGPAQVGAGCTGAAAHPARRDHPDHATHVREPR
ncbi:MAG: tryptophan 2,3-dioxygenase family protein [Kofleriaceae bacterium]